MVASLHWAGIGGASADGVDEELKGEGQGDDIEVRVLNRRHGSYREETPHSSRIDELFCHDDEPANLALARAVARAAKLDLDVAIDGRFVVLADGVKAMGCKQ